MFQYVLAEHPFFMATGALYAAATAFYAVTWKSTKQIIARIATLLMCMGLAMNTAVIIGRWVESGREPFKSLFESLVFFAFNMGALYLVMERLYKTRVFGLPAAAMSFGLVGYALSKWDAEIVKLPPALQSPWFAPHVIVYFIGYAAVAFAAGVALLQILSTRVPLVQKALNLELGTAFSGKKLDLDQITYDAIRFGFVLLTIGLLVGSVWAKSAWGDYWVWDPKENWSLVSWLFYGAYLHLRKVKGWKGERAAWLAMIGFAVIMFTYLGMKYLPTADASAHVYTG